MSQEIKTWLNRRGTSSIAYYLEELVKEAYTIEQILPTRYTGNSLFKVIDRAVIVCSRPNYHSKE